MVAHLVWDQRAARSNRAIPTIIFFRPPVRSVPEVLAFPPPLLGRPRTLLPVAQSYPVAGSEIMGHKDKGYADKGAFRRHSSVLSLNGQGGADVEAFSVLLALLRRSR